MATIFTVQVVMDGGDREELRGYLEKILETAVVMQDGRGEPIVATAIVVETMAFIMDGKGAKQCDVHDMDPDGYLH